MRKNDEFDVKIEDMSNLGHGICRIDGMAAFVIGAVDGDECHVKLIKTASDYCVAKIEKLIKPSIYRISDDCESSKRCGGCVYRNIDYRHELELKRRYIAGALRKNGLDVPVAETVSNGVTDGWRNKVQYPVGENGELGFYAAHSHTIVRSETCGIQSRSLDEVIGVLRKYFCEHGNCGVKHIFARVAEGTGEIMVGFVTKSEKFKYGEKLARELTERFPNVKSVIQNINPDDTNVILGDKCRVLYGKDTIRDVLCGLSFDISLKAFYQVNHTMTERLYKYAGELAGIKPGMKLVDLYCGIGTIGLYLASNTPEIELTGVEICEEAVVNAKANAGLNNISNARFICADAGAREVNEADVIVIDPPRKGASPELVKRLCQVSPEKIIYISCSPDTLSRDLKLFLESGYTAKSAVPFDLFPRTGHVETVVLMSRKDK